ncbi:MAG: SET domain-containing protein [Methylobacteriaceae bacterium]|nr:SET domain-containing protein [Methylobacteriaceae bacterium]
MLLVRTTLAPSAIHGIGVFAFADIGAGEPVWRFDPAFDLVIAPDQVAGAPPAFRAYLETYAYLSPDVPAGHLVLPCDHAKFLNHSEDPNTESSGPLNRALRHIRAGEELTCDYRACVAGWTGFGPSIG